MKLKRLIKELLIKLVYLFRLFIKSERIDFFISRLLSKKFSRNRLEITSTIGCAMMCDYCPQTLIKSTLDKNINNRILQKKNFINYFKNIPNSTIIHWSGYSEPLAHKDFPFFAEYLRDNNYEQHISTTMFGRPDTEIFMSKFNFFGSVTFHLPDDSKLMKLKVGQRYLKNLESALIYQASNLHFKNIYIVVFGKNFHPDVSNLIFKLLDKKIINKKSIDIRDHLHSRNNEITKMNGFRVTSRKLENSKFSNKLFYCSYGRLDQGVLVPNGDINICCHDYSLKGIVGNIKNNNISDIYVHENLFKNKFHYGQSNICNKCEYYKEI